MYDKNRKSDGGEARGGLLEDDTQEVVYTEKIERVRFKHTAA